MDLKEYRKKAKELGGKIRVRTTMMPFTCAYKQVVTVHTADGTNISGDVVVGKAFRDANIGLFQLAEQIENDAELKAAGYVV